MQPPAKPQPTPGYRLVVLMVEQADGSEDGQTHSHQDAERLWGVEKRNQKTHGMQGLGGAVDKTG